MAQQYFADPALSSAAYGGAYGAAAYQAVPAYGGYSSYAGLQQQAVPYGGAVQYGVANNYGGGLAAYGAPPRAGFYSSSSSIDEDLVYGGGAVPYGAGVQYVQQQQPQLIQARPVQVQVQQQQQQAATGPVLTGLPAASSFGGASGQNVEQYGVNLAPQIEAAYEAAALHRRQPVVRRQVIQVPGPVGQVRQVVRRVPTPIPDVIERVFVVKPQRDVVNLVIERPNTPPPQIKTRTVIAKPRRPIIQSQVVRVAPQVRYQPQAQIQYAPQPVQLQPQPVLQQVVQQPAIPYAAAAPQYDYGYQGGYPQGYASYSSSETLGGGYGVQQYGGYYGQQPQYAAAPMAYNYGAAQYAAYPAASYGYTASVAQPAAAYAPGSVVAANPAAGSAYYGAGYPQQAYAAYARY